MSTGCQEALKASLYEQQQDGKKSEEDPTAHGGTLSDAAARSSPESNNIGDIPVGLCWAYGFDKGVRNGVHSLTRSSTEEQAVLFPASNTAVLHIYGGEAEASQGGRQVLLRGHANRISAVAVSEDKEWIATGDMGQESLLIVWNRTQAKHVKVYTNPHPMGVSSIDFTPDGKLLATLSSLIPENYIMGKAPSQKASECLDTPAKEGTERADYSDTTNRNGSAVPSDIYQGVAIWNWKDSGNSPLRVAVIATPDIQHEIRFNQWDVNELLTSGRRRVLFWYWHAEDSSFHFYSPALQSKTFKQKIGDITTSLFVPRSTKALSGTSDGDLVMWNLSLILDGLSRPDERRAVSILRLRNSCLTCLKTFHDRWIVAGFSDGAVCFYDAQLRLVRCFEDLDAGQIKCLSFVETTAPDTMAQSRPHLEGSASASKKASASARRQWMADLQRLPAFVVSTSKARIIEVSPSEGSTAAEPILKEARIVNIFEGLDSVPTALVVHPVKPILAAAGVTGFVRFWNTVSHALLGNVWFDKLSPTAAAFSPSGVFLAIGFSNGTVKICEFKIPENFTATALGGDISNWMPELISTRESRDAVTHCTFCRNSTHLAVAHADHLVCLFRFDCRLGNPQLPEEWTFAGKHRSHYRRICGLSFAHSNGQPPLPSMPPAGGGPTAAALVGPAQSFASRPSQHPLPTASPHLYREGYPRLFSVGEDRSLVEYDLTNSFEHTGLLKRASRIVEQRALPAGCLALPSPAGEPDTEVLIYSTEAKATIWSANSMACVKTASVAIGNGGVLQLALVQDWANAADAEGKFRPVLLGACKEQLLGIFQLPLDGDPFKSVSVVAHAGQIVAVAASAPHNGHTMLFSCGGSDFTVLQWRVNHEAVQRSFRKGPPGVESILSRIPGKSLGKFYRTAKEFFYYSQLRSQGERTTRSRRLGGTVPVRELPNLLCAMGEAPTQLDLHNLLSECRGTHGIMHRQVTAATSKGGVETPPKPGNITFERFLELYLNQRISRPFQYSDVLDAFKQLSKGKDGGEISPDTLTKLLTTTGEAMTETELSHCLEVLTGSPSLSLLCSRGNVSGDFFARRVLQMEPTTALPGSHN